MRPAYYDLPSLKDVHNAAQLISDMVVRTPIKSYPRLTDKINRSLHQTEMRNPDSKVQLLLKCENLQRTGSFKFRGAYHFLSKRTDAELKHGVVAYSTGTVPPLPSTITSSTYTQETKPLISPPRKPRPSRRPRHPPHLPLPHPPHPHHRRPPLLLPPSQNLSLKVPRRNGPPIRC